MRKGCPRQSARPKATSLSPYADAVPELLIIRMKWNRYVVHLRDEAALVEALHHFVARRAVLAEAGAHHVEVMTARVAPYRLRRAHAIVTSQCQVVLRHQRPAAL